MQEAGLLEVNDVRVGVGGGTLLVATAALVVASPPTAVFTAALAAVTGLCSLVVRRPGALLLGVTGWALCTGFGVNELGQLTFAPADLVRLAAYVGCALLLGGERFPAQ